MIAAQATNNMQYLGNDGSLRFLEWYDTEGTRIKTASEMGVKGTPLLREGWGSGVVQYQSGEKVAYKAINYSLSEQKLYYTQNKKLYQVVNAIEYFTIGYLTIEGDSVSYHFKKGIPAIDQQNENSFYEVLFEGNNLQLLQWNHKKMKDIFNYGGSREKEFVLDQQLYVYQLKENKLRALKQALPAIKKTLPAYAAIIQAYADRHKISVRDKDELVHLIAYLDEQH